MTPRFGIRAEDQAFAEAISRFARGELAPLAQEVDEGEISTVRYVPKLAAMGVMGMNLPAQWGGIDASPTALVLALAEIAAACTSTASMIGAHYLATESILIGADDNLRRRYLTGAAEGKLLGAFALTEPRAGSNPVDMATRATREGAHYRLTGSKHFISNAGEADFIVVFAKTDIAAKHKGISAFVLDRDTPGLTISAPEKLMGIRGGHAFEIALDCLVPAGNRLGEEGTGFRTAMKVLDNSRIDVAANCLGLSEAALAAAVAYVQERQVGGEALANKQGVQWTLADMRVRLEAAWALTLSACVKREAGVPYTMESAMCKLYASEAAAFITDAALQLHGGYGYTRGLPLERYVRDARIMRIYEGSSEIQRTLIARQVLASH